EQLGADLRVGLPVARHPGDLGLLGREDVAGLHGPPRRGLAGGQQLAAGALSERPRAGPVEASVGGAKLPACVDAPVPAAQPVAIPSRAMASKYATPSASWPRHAVSQMRAYFTAAVPVARMIASVSSISDDAASNAPACTCRAARYVAAVGSILSAPVSRATR